MADAVVVSTARTPIGEAHRGALNLTGGADLAAHAIRRALDRARLEPEAVEEVVLGCGYPENATGGNVARHAAPVAGIPVQSAGVTVSRFRASGLEAIAAAAARIRLDGVPVAVAGGVEPIGLVQPKVQRDLTRNAWLEARLPAIYMPMIETADVVAARYGVSREAQDAFALESQRRTAAAQERGLFDGEIVPMSAVMAVTTTPRARPAGSRRGSRAARATGRTRRAKVWPSSSRCAGRAPSSRGTAERARRRSRR